MVSTWIPISNQESISTILVARRAEAILNDQSVSGAIKFALTELDTLNKNHPGMITSEKDHPFTECATFADEIKETWGNW